MEMNFGRWRLKAKAGAVILGLLMLKALFTGEFGILLFFSAIFGWLWWNEEKYIAFWDRFRALTPEEANRRVDAQREQNREYLQNEVARYRRICESNAKEGNFSRAAEYRAKAERAESELRALD